MYKKHQITALDSKDVLFLGYTFFFNKLKNFDIKDTEGQTYKTNVSRESRLQQWLVTTGSDKHHTDWVDALPSSQKNSGHHGGSFLL